MLMMEVNLQLFLPASARLWFVLWRQLMFLCSSVVGSPPPALLGRLKRTDGNNIMLWAEWFC